MRLGLFALEDCEEEEGGPGYEAEEEEGVGAAARWRSRRGGEGCRHWRLAAMALQYGLQERCMPGFKVIVSIERNIEIFLVAARKKVEVVDDRRVSNQFRVFRYFS